MQKNHSKLKKKEFYDFFLVETPHWPALSHPIEAKARLYFAPKYLELKFMVRENPATFRAATSFDGDNCWEDSCVELFVQIPGSDTYANFEFAASGYCLAAQGPDRHQRTQRSPAEYARILRQVQVQNQDSQILWHLTAQIPWELLQLSAPPPTLRGNLYKCGDATTQPHWLSAFPINTPRPDFHRPEYFQDLRATATHFGAQNFHIMGAKK